MKKLTLIILSILMTLVLAASMPGLASADEAVVPFKATYATTFTTRPVPPCNELTILGTGQATHLGESTFYSISLACPATQTQTGSLEFTAANGDKLFGSFSGEMAVAFPIVTFRGDYIMTDGTGRFFENTGAGAYIGTANLLTGTGTITFNGELYK